MTEDQPSRREHAIKLVMGGSFRVAPEPRRKDVTDFRRDGMERQLTTERVSTNHPRRKFSARLDSLFPARLFVRRPNVGAIMPVTI